MDEISKSTTSEFEAVLEEFKSFYCLKVKDDNSEESKNLHVKLMNACEKYVDVPQKVNEQGKTFLVNV